VKEHFPSRGSFSATDRSDLRIFGADECSGIDGALSSRVSIMSYHVDDPGMHVYQVIYNRRFELASPRRRLRKRRSICQGILESLMGD